MNPLIKKILLACTLLFVVMHGRSQTFEGIISWTITTEITDPKVKAQMEQAQKQMSDPANQARMKEMLAKMEDPQMKAMMESNPQMKAQMEAMVKAMQGGDLSSMIPKGVIVKTKNGNSLVSMEGGAMASMETLYLKDKDQAYTLNRDAKTYMLMPKTTDEDMKKSADESKVTKTNETTKVLGYTCTKYLVTTATSKEQVTQAFWTTTEIKDFDMKAMSRQRMGNQNESLFMDKIDGVPLKIEMNMPQGHMTMVAKEIKRQSVPATTFAIPADYKETKMPHYGGK
jgi:hypothetical protein